jgi:hypothetical protein
VASRKKVDDDQRERFIKAAREAGCSEDEAVFDENLKRIASAKPTPLKSLPKSRRKTKDR